MIVSLSSDAEVDIRDAYSFYERQAIGLGSYFRDSLVADIESLAFFGGIHGKTYGYHCMRAKRFPFVIYYECERDEVTVVAVLDARRSPSWTRDRLT